MKRMTAQQKQTRIHQTVHSARISHLASRTQESGFTLIETLVAVSILTIAVMAPMTLATKSLSSAYYARDQVTAYHLAQEGLETVRSVRDANILVALSGTPRDPFTSIPTDQPFTIDSVSGGAIKTFLSESEVPPLRNNGSGVYGYEPAWTPTRFVRVITARPIGGEGYMLEVSSKVSWQSGAFQPRSFTISTVMYEWVDLSDNGGN
jgi:prepilin-type N-terminal cleavage/methylation domain-containing protein